MKSFAKQVSLVALTWAALNGMAGTALAQTSNPSESPSTEEAIPARTSPRYLLQGSHGRAVMSENFHDRFQLITFGFTGCADICPTSMLEMKQVLEALGQRAQYVQALFITIDPARDTVDVLDTYTRNFDDRILGLTGSPELVQWAANNFKVKVEKVQEAGAAPNVYTMDHSAGMFLLGPDGQLLNKFIYGTPVTEMVTRIESWLAEDKK